MQVHHMWIFFPLSFIKLCMIFITETHQYFGEWNTCHIKLKSEVELEGFSGGLGHPFFRKNFVVFIGNHWSMHDWSWPLFRQSVGFYYEISGSTTESLSKVRLSIKFMTNYVEICTDNEWKIKLIKNIGTSSFLYYY